MIMITIMIMMRRIIIFSNYDQDENFDKTLSTSNQMSSYHDHDYDYDDQSVINYDQNEVFDETRIRIMIIMIREFTIIMSKMRILMTTMRITLGGLPSPS